MHQKLSAKLSQYIDNVSPDRVFDVRVATSAATSGGAAILGMNADDLTVVLQLVATIGGIMVSAATFVYMALGIVGRYRALKRGQHE